MRTLSATQEEFDGWQFAAVHKDGRAYVFYTAEEVSIFMWGKDSSRWAIFRRHREWDTNDIADLRRQLATVLDLTKRSRDEAT